MAFQQPPEASHPPRLDTKALGVFVAGYLYGAYLMFIEFLGWESVIFLAPFISYWGWIAAFFGLFGIIILPAPYGIYALIAYWRKRKLGLRLFILHYAAALLISLLVFIFRDDEIAVTVKQMHVLADHPFYVAALVVPFVAGNIWYLWRLRRIEDAGANQETR